MNLQVEIINKGVGHAKEAFKRMGYKWGDYNVIGIRSNDVTVDVFNDCIAVVTASSLSAWPGTTDPGKPALSSPVHAEGTAILVPGQYVDAYKLDIHNKGKKTEHQALCQRLKPVNVWRDNNRDNKLDMGGKIYSGMFGINIHRASAYKKLEEVGLYSAGCQVFQSPDQYLVFYEMCMKHAEKTKNAFTYTLFTQDEYFA